MEWSFTGSLWPSNAKVSGKGGRLLTVTGVEPKNQGRYNCHHKSKDGFKISHGSLVIGEFDFSFTKNITARHQGVNGLPYQNSRVILPNDY